MISNTIASINVMKMYYLFIEKYCIKSLFMTKIKLEDNYIKKDDDLELIYKGEKIIFSFKDNDKMKFFKKSYINNNKKWLQFPIIGFNNLFYDINICK